MSPLSKEEILAQLEKIGIVSASEVDFYFREYKDYTTDRLKYSPAVYHENDTPYKRHTAAASRLKRIYQSFAPRITGTVNALKTRTSRGVK